MHLSLLDWGIVGAALLLVLGTAAYTRRYTRGVADFLSANRCAGRYLMSVAQGMVAFGAISMVANFEQFYQAGFGAAWWMMMLMPVSMLITLTGFVIYRYRETRVLTMAQLFELRYSRPFRRFMGIVIFVSGLLNYAIFPQVTANFIVAFFGFPKNIAIWGMQVPSIAPVMLVILGCAILIACCGGQIAVMVTDFLQGQMVNITMIVIMIFLLSMFSWGTITETLMTAPAGASMLNPFDQNIGKIKDFNMFFFLMQLVLLIYQTRAWQGGMGYATSAKSPHEARMAFVIGEWRSMITGLSLMLIPIAAWVLMRDPQFSTAAAAVTSSLTDYADNPQMQKQLLVPFALSQMLPVGLIGMFAVIIICAAISTDDTCLHSWGSIFIQDVIMPFRKKPFTPETHMLLLRLSIIGVAVFAFVWGLVFEMREYILMYQQITGAIYMGGAGSIIIGGLYWKRGTTMAAWLAMITGSALAIAGIAIRCRFPEFPLNGMQFSFLSAISSIAVYVTVSLLKPAPPFDLDKLLNRSPGNVERRRSFMETLGINSDFSTFDKCLYFFKMSWALGWFAVFIIGTTVNLIWHIPDSIWAAYWKFKIYLTLYLGIGTAVWFICGGARDMMRLFRHLAECRRDTRDDGWVTESSATDKPQ